MLISILLHMDLIITCFLHLCFGILLILKSVRVMLP